MSQGVFARLGRDATWQGSAETVRVILRDGDASFGEVVTDNVIIRGRESEVAEPVSGSEVNLTDGRDSTVIGTPLLNRRREWVCEAKPA